MSRVVDFRPVAVPGWRAIYAQKDPPGWYAAPMVGFLIIDVDDDEGGYSVKAAVVEDYEVVEVDQWGDCWYVAAPGDPDPTPEEVDRERARVAERDRKRVEQRHADDAAVAAILVSGAADSAEVRRKTRIPEERCRDALGRIARRRPDGRHELVPEALA